GGVIGELAVDLRRDHAWQQIPLAGLTPAATQELIALRTDTPPEPDFVRRTHARTGGNPFFIEQLLHVGPHAPVPAGVKELIAQRVRRLTAPAAAETLQIA